MLSSEEMYIRDLNLRPLDLQLNAPALSWGKARERGCSLAWSQGITGANSYLKYQCVGSYLGWHSSARDVKYAEEKEH